MSRLATSSEFGDGSVIRKFRNTVNLALPTEEVCSEMEQATQHGPGCSGIASLHAPKIKIDRKETD